MAPLATSLDILQGDKEMYMGYLLPVISTLQENLEGLNNLTYCKPMADSILSGVQKR